MKKHLCQTASWQIQGFFQDTSVQQFCNILRSTLKSQTCLLRKFAKQKFLLIEEFCQSLGCTRIKIRPLLFLQCRRVFKGTPIRGMYRPTNAAWIIFSCHGVTQPTAGTLLRNENYMLFYTDTKILSTLVIESPGIYLWNLPGFSTVLQKSHGCFHTTRLR